MNKIYKVVWSKAKHCYVVVSELAKQNTKGCGARNLRMAAVSLGVAAMLIGNVGFATPVAEAGQHFTISNYRYTSSFLSWQPDTKSVTVTASTNDSFNRSVTTESDGSLQRYVIGNVAYEKNGIPRTNVLVRDYRSAYQIPSFMEDGESVRENAGKVATEYQEKIDGYAAKGADVSGYTVTLDMSDRGDVSSAYGGYSQNGYASNNTINVKSGTMDCLTGGYSNVKDANGNTVNVSGGTVKQSLMGGWSWGAGNTNSNTVTISNGSVRIVYGGWADGNDANANGNRVTISNGTSECVIGGFAANETNQNIVTISGGTIASSYEDAAVIGARNYGAHDATNDDTSVANKNEVTISGTAKVTGDVFGAMDYGYGAVATTENEVTIDGSASVTGAVMGGASYSRDQTNNKVYVKNGTVTGNVYGGRLDNTYETAATGNANANRVEVSGGTVNGKAVGGAVNGNVTGNATENSVAVNGGTVTDTIFGGNSDAGTVTGNTVTVNKGTVNTIYGGYSNSGTVTGNTVTVSNATLNGAVIGGTNGDGDANGNTVSIAGGTIGGAVWGGYSRNGDAKNNTVTVTDMAAGRAIYGGYAENSAKDATGNTVTIKNVTATAAYHNLEGGYTRYTTTPTGDFVTGNTLIISGANKFGGVIDNFETIKLANDFAWKNGATVLQGKFGVNYDGTRPALDIIGAETALSSATSGSMTLLASSSANDFSTLSLKYSGGSATLNASKPSQEVLSGEGSASEDKGVTVTSSTKHTVSLDQANSYKNVLYTVETGLASKISLGDMAWETPRALSGFTFGTTATVDAADLTFTGKSTTPLQVNDSRTLVSGATGIASLPAANITQPGTGKGTVAIEHTDANGLKFNATATGTVGVAGTDVKYTVTGVTADSIDLSGWKGTTASTVPTGWTGAGIAVSGSFTEPEMEVNSKKDIVTGAASGFFTDAGIDDAIKYKEGAGFTGDKANGVTLAGKQSKGVQAADSGKKLVYAVGAKEVTEVTLGNMAAGAPRTMEDGYDFSGVTTIKAGSLEFDKPEEVKADAALVANAAGLTAGKTVTDADHTQSFTKKAENQVVLSASLKGTVETAANAVNYTYGGTELTKVDLANWNGSNTTFDATGWTLAKDASGAVTATVETDGMNVSSMNPGDEKPVLTVTGVDLTGIKVNGQYEYKVGGESIAETSAHESGVTITAGTTTGGGVKVSETNTNQLIYQKDKKDVTGITLGSVAYEKGGTARTFNNSYDLTNADITATGFSLSNATTATMNAGDTMVVVDATNAIKADGEATKTLKDFATKTMDLLEFSDDISGTVLTFAGKHTDTLEQNEAKTQIVYKVGDKNVEAVTLDGSVTWDDSKAYYENKADANGKFAYTFNGATNVDAENLKVAGTSNTLLKADGSSSMTLLSATGMTVGTFTDQSEANKAASKVSVNYKDDKGVAFKAEAKGEVKAEAAAVKYSINEVKLTEVDLSAWTGSESSVPDTWTAEVGSVKVATGSFAEPDVAIGSARTILTAGSAFFADVNISGANKYDEANGKAFSETQNNVTVSGTQAKGVAASEDSKSLVYKVDIKKADTVSFGATNWQKGATLFDGSSATEYDYANVTAVGTGKFDVTYASPEKVVAGESMTLLKANETLTAIINEEKAKAYSFSPVSGVTVDAAITGKLTNSNNNVVFTAAANQASKLTFGDVEWKDSGALMTRPSNITFASADVDTSKINFTNMIYLDADRQMTLVSDFGDKVGTITGSKYLVGTAFEGEGAASLSGSDLVFRTKTGAGVSEQTHKTVMATEVGVTMLTVGNDYIGKAMEGMGDLANVAPDGTTVGAAIGGGRNRYETGSHVNVNSWNAAVAVGAKRELKNGSLEYGVFGEYGKANFTLHSDAGKGDGDAHYAGGGLLAKWTNKHDVYTEASFRLGRLNESSSDIMRDGLGNAYGYDVHANYYGAHVGVGKIFRYNGGRSLDVYGKYFYTKRNGVEFDAVQHYNLDSVSSSVLRVGARYGTTDKKWNWYGGLAYEYEFDGEAEGVVNGVAIRAASIKGSSVRGEIGLRMNATKTNPWQTDISIYGYGGKHRGFGGNVNVAYMF